MNTRIHNIKKRSIITLSCLLFSIGAMAQAFSSGGGSATGYKSTLGNQNTASGNYSFAAGWGSQATGQTSIALEMTLRMIEMEKRIHELESQSVENNQ